MSSTSMSRRIDQTPIAVVDLETTGLSPGGDRVVEVSVVRIEPGEKPQLVLDTLINPQRSVAATEIHGIRDKDIADAPTFAEMAGDFIRALYGCVVASYNVYFDVGFLRDELSRVGIIRVPPHVCLMYLRPMLGLGNRCSLNDACRAHGIDHGQAHQAATDALAAARLWSVYADAFRRAGILTFADLARLKSYKFVSSWIEEPYSPPIGSNMRSISRVKSRSRVATVPARMGHVDAMPDRGRENFIHEYWEALKSVLSDLDISPEEQTYLAQKRDNLGLTTQEVRAVHARAFADVLRACADDRVLSDDECQTIRLLHKCLGQLGWAPGQ